MRSPTINPPTLGSRASCAWCGNLYRMQRTAQRYCSPRCQKTGRRAELAAGIDKSQTLTGRTPVGGFSTKKISAYNGMQAHEARSSLPLNLLGGHQWPHLVPVDRQTLQKIIWAEIGGEIVAPPATFIATEWVA
jgi:hypothetical protein